MMMNGNLLLRAAELHNIDAAARLIQDSLGQFHGDIAGLHLSHVYHTWSRLSHQDRVRALAPYLIAEAQYIADQGVRWADGEAIVTADFAE